MPPLLVKLMLTDVDWWWCNTSLAEDFPFVFYPSLRNFRILWDPPWAHGRNLKTQIWTMTLSQNSFQNKVHYGPGQWTRYNLSTLHHDQKEDSVFKSYYIPPKRDQRSMIGASDQLDTTQHFSINPWLNWHHLRSTENPKLGNLVFSKAAW